ncbi:flagellar basal body rod protein FlgB [Terriglobus tenax]|uniref:flagellar basal body rod protein FlgB n=1 Tax=Terriglobus tenax TaxID=1111115 RepID=UPI0021E08295|nr:flagellar basal body protein [Terriglobus tenax]
MSDALVRYLDLASTQMKLTASNIANADTPGYRTQGFSFEEQMRQAMSGSASGAFSPEVQDVDGLVARTDGNNVSLEREGLEMAKSQLTFRTGVDLLRHEYSRMTDAIKSDGK